MSAATTLIACGIQLSASTLSKGSFRVAEASGALGALGTPLFILLDVS